MFRKQPCRKHDEQAIAAVSPVYRPDSGLLVRTTSSDPRSGIPAARQPARRRTRTDNSSQLELALE